MPLQKVANTDISTTGSFSFPVISGNTVIQATDNTNAALRITQLGTGNALVVEDSANPDSTPFVVDASGLVTQGFTSTLSFAGAAGTVTPTIQAIAPGSSLTQGIASTTHVNSSNGPNFIFGKSRGASASSPTAVASGDILGNLTFTGYDGSAYLMGALINSIVDGTPGTNDLPTRLGFWTTADGASTPTERMRINSSGDVGIGTSTPTHRFEVFESSDARMRINNGTNILELGAISGLGFLQTFSTDPMIFYTGGGERIRITSGGAVSINNASPNTNNLLTVGSINGVTRSNIVAVQGSGLVDNYGNCIEFGHSNAAGYRSTLGAFVGTGAPFLGLSCEAGTTGNTFRTRGLLGTTISTDNNGAMTFNRITNSNADNQTAVESMRIDSSGNVGIGISSPSYRLDVSGTSNIITRILGNNTNDAALLISNANNTNYGTISAMGSSGYGVTGWANSLVIESVSNSTGGLTLSSYNGAMLFQTGTGRTERMRITSGGSVGIATTSPVASLEIYRANSTTGSQTDTSLMLSTSATTGRKVNIGFGLGGGVANTLAATIGYDVTNGAGAGLGDIFFSTRNTTADSVPTERMRLDSNGKFYVASGSDFATGYAPFQQSYVTRFTNLGTTPQAVNYLAGNAFVAHFFLQTVGGNPHQASFTIYGGRQAAVAHRFTGYAGGNCSISETSEGVFSITGLGDGVTYTLTIGTGSPSATLAASSTQTGTTTLTAFCISSAI